MNRSLCLGLVGVVLTAVTAKGANAHPGAPLASPQQAKQAVFSPGKGEFDDRFATCRGMGAASARRFKHFRCIIVRNDGLRSSIIMHTTPGGGWDFGFVDALASPGVALNRSLTVAKKSVSGAFGTVVVSGSLSPPASVLSPFEVRVIVAPDQPVDVRWTVVCAGDGRAATKSGKARVLSLMAAQVKVPFLGADTCSVSALASIRKSGKLTVTLRGLK
jgi:hypothetical protein